MKIEHGDCLTALSLMDDNSVDACVTDPPYGLEFMGKDWDAPYKQDRRQPHDGTLKDDRNSPLKRQKVRYGIGASYNGHVGNMQAFQLWFQPVAEEILRVLKPGGYLLCFGGTRTYHRVACAIEDAGFEVRDQIQWVYGSGFPKNLDVSKAIDKKLGGERKVVGQKRGQGNIPNDRGNWGLKKTDTVDVTAPGTPEAARWAGWGTALKPSHEPICVARKPLVGTVAANVLDWGTGGLNIDGCRVEGIKDTPASPRRAPQNATYGDLSNDPGTGSGWNPNVGRWPSNLIHDGSDEVLALFPDSKGQQGDVRGTEKSRTGGEGTNCYGEYGRVPFTKRQETDKSAARFFYCAKTSRKERGAGNNHPTVKPLALMRYLVRLVTSPGGTVLDPFAGSGTTGLAALHEGFNPVLIEREEEYVRIIENRLLPFVLD